MEQSLDAIWKVQVQTHEGEEKDVSWGEEKEHCGVITIVLATPLIQFL